MQKRKPSMKLNEAARERRRSAGLYLKQLREAAGLSQRRLALATGVEHYPFIAQLEHGLGRVPAERYDVWAAALGVQERTFAIEMMKFYDRALFDLLFMPADGEASSPNIQEATTKEFNNKQVFLIDGGRSPWQQANVDNLEQSPAMPQYFFNVIGQDSHADLDGVSLSGKDAAWNEACQITSELLPLHSERLKGGESWRLQVCDERKSVLFEIVVKANILGAQ